MLFRVDYRTTNEYYTKAVNWCKRDLGMSNNRSAKMVNTSAGKAFDVTPRLIEEWF